METIVFPLASTLESVLNNADHEYSRITVENENNASRSPGMLPGKGVWKRALELGLFVPVVILKKTIHRWKGEGLKGQARSGKTRD